MLVSGIDADNDDEPWSRKIIFMIGKLVGAAYETFEELCCRKDYVVPKIMTITRYGEVKIAWSKPMVRIDLNSLKRRLSATGFEVNY